MEDAPTHRDATLRLSAWYAASVGTIALIPYLAVLLGDTGLTNQQVAASLTLLPLGALVGAPAWSYLADRLQAPRRVLLYSTVATFLCGVALLATHHGVLMAGILLAWALSKSPQSAIADSLAVRALPPQGYGAVRLWGSIAFLVVAWLNGALRASSPRAPLVLGLVLMAAAVVVSTRLPTPKRAALAAPVRLRELLRVPAIGPLFAVGVLHGLGLTAYDNLFSLHIERLHISSVVTGSAIAVGVGSEVLVLAASRRLLTVVPAGTLLVIGVASSVPRFWLTATLTDPTALVATQALHGLGFGAYWVAGVALFSKHAPPGLEASTQSLLSASTFGVGYLASMIGATLLLGAGTTSTVFMAIAGISVVATAGAVYVAATGPLPRPRGSSSDRRG